jgi:hypothetical protein
MRRSSVIRLLALVLLLGALAGSRTARIEYLRP